MQWIAITPKQVIINGEIQMVNSHGEDLLTELYKKYIGDYPKFYKMDLLCKLSFIASDLLLIDENERFTQREDRAVVLFNKVASLHADSSYQGTISNKDNYFPSPSVFVYTLPNITTGEIAIRNKYFGETSFYVLEDINTKIIAQQIKYSFYDNKTNSVIGGWVDCENENNFLAILLIVNKNEEEIIIENKLNQIVNTCKLT